MQIIIDTNILFSALIKDSITRKLILEYEGKFLFPLYIFEEFENHKDEIWITAWFIARRFAVIQIDDCIKNKLQVMQLSIFQKSKMQKEEFASCGFDS